MCKIFSVLVVILVSTGCASKLKTFDSAKKESPGVPIISPVLMKVTSIIEYQVAAGSDHAPYASYCVNEEISKLEILPLGQIHYLAFEPSPLAKGEFKLEFNEAGNLKTVSLNSDASSGVDSVSGFLETVLPFVKAPKSSGSADPAGRVASPNVPASTLKKAHCQQVGTKIKGIEKVQANL